jgi:uncharacterized protein involved in exopolysaccharide biosynthesis
MNVMMAAPEAENEEAASGFVAALPSVLWQRRWLIIISLSLTTISGILAAYLIHPVYESSATVLIEAQQISDQLLSVQSRDTGDAISQRIARARERVLSRQDLIRLIRQYNLYPTEQATQPLSKIVDKMRNDTTIGAISSSFDANRARRGLPANTVAIQVAFDYDDPVKAQAVAQQYVDRFLEIDASTQESQAADSVNFLTEQADQLTSQIAAVENKILSIKGENGTVLALSESTGNQAADVARIDSQIVSLQAENARLADSPASQDNAVATADAQLRVAEAKYADTHPDVLAAKAQLEAAKRAAASGGAASTSQVPGMLASNRTQIAALERARNIISSRSSSASAAQSRAPLLNAQIDQLQKQSDALREQSRAIGTKLQAAQIQQRVESEQKGERLTLADPPIVPDSPTKPNRPMLILGSIAAGLGLGVGIVLLIELLMRPIRGTAAVRYVLGVPPLAVVPDFDRKPSWIARFVEKRTRKKFARD